MTAFIVTVLLIVMLAAVSLPLIVWNVRRRLQEMKNFERGLKMVPLLIHLPPMSEDIDAPGRDTRDIVDENISKAQTIYNIVASTTQKGFKSNLYGQRHFAFEIIGSKGFVYFYAMVPMALVNVVKQAIISAYSTAQIEQVAEHNIFNRVGKLSGVVGGEFVLKKNYAYPIATYQEIRRDTMQALLNALSTLDKEDGASIQILLRPAHSQWQQNASSLAGELRKGHKSSTGIQNVLVVGKQLVEALYKPPESNDGKKEGAKELSNLEQSVLDSIDDKTRYQGYEVLIRVVVSSNVVHRSQAILANITASFSLFDAPGKNGFKYVPAPRIDSLVSDYLMRIFPQNKNQMILNSVELSTLFHFPDQRSIPTSQLRRQESKQVDAPRNMPNDGLLLGYNVFRGVKKPIRLQLQDRQRHMYVVGQTGTGKSTFLENLALQDMLNGDGFAFVDPHGDTVERLLAMVPKERTEDIVYFSPADMAHPMGLNIFEFSSPDQKDFLIQEALNMLYKLYDPQHQGIMGPRYEHLFRNAALTVMADPEGGTFIDIPKLFRDQKYVQQKLKYVNDLNVREFWEKEIPKSQRSNEYGEVISWFVSKFGAFLSNEMMRNIIGQTTSAFNLREIMDNKKILLVNLSKGRTGQLNMQLLGMIFVMKFQAAAMSRANVPESEREDFALYVDEFQNFSTDSFATILSEARKYHLNLIAANQFTHQLTEEIRDAVFGNVGTTIAFRVGDRDAESLHKYFRPAFDETDLIRMPSYNAAVRTMIGGVPTLPFSMATLPPLGSPNTKLAEALKQLSAAKYGRPRQAVEEEIFARMATKTEEPFAAQSASTSSPASVWSSWPTAPQPAGSPMARQQAAPMTSTKPAAPKTGSSFLDEWLAKREAKTSQQSAFAKPTAPQPISLGHHVPQELPRQMSASPLDGAAIAGPLSDRQPVSITPAPNTVSPMSAGKAPERANVQGVRSDLQSDTKAGVVADAGQFKQNQPNDQNDASDTIYIDQEGTLHLKDEQ